MADLVHTALFPPSTTLELVNRLRDQRAPAITRCGVQLDMRSVPEGLAPCEDCDSQLPSGAVPICWDAPGPKVVPVWSPP